QYGARRSAEGDRSFRARARNLRAARTGLARPAPVVRRHRRDRRLSHRDQRHLPNRHSRGEKIRRRRYCRADLGQDRSAMPPRVIGHLIRRLAIITRVWNGVHGLFLTPLGDYVLDVLEWTL